MHPLEYSVCLWVSDTGWLMLQTILITEGLKSKFELTYIVVDNVLATWVMAKPGLVY